MPISSLPDHLHFFSKTHDQSALWHVGTRYDEQGTFLVEPGNTIVCHLKKGALSTQAVLDARTRMQALPESEKLTFTDEASLHMTLFQGIIEYRRKLPFWPEDMPLDTPIDAMTEEYLDRLSGFQAPGSFKVEVIGATPNGLIVAGATDADRRIMKEWRNQLADILGYRHPNHDNYEFHITFTYLLERFSDEAMLVWQRGLAEIVENLQEYAPIIELNPPAFCAFKDMNHFEELMVLK